MQFNYLGEISILMCVYREDNPQYLDKALESVKIQSGFFYEVIIVEDGILPSELKKVINKFKKLIKIKQISLNKNVGLPRALNIGLSQSNTKWIARFDSDDICDINRFKYLNEIIKNHSNEIDVFGTYMKEFEDTVDDQNKIRYVPLKQKDIKKRLILSNPMNHISVVFRRSLIEKYCCQENQFYPLISGFEDYALWVKLLNDGVRFRNFPMVTVYARVGNEMLKRRGGLKYILNEMKFRKFSFKYFNIYEKLLLIIITILRIFIFLLPVNLKKKLYKLKRLFLWRKPSLKKL